MQRHKKTMKFVCCAWSFLWVDGDLPLIFFLSVVKKRLRCYRDPVLACHSIGLNSKLYALSFDFVWHFFCCVRQYFFFLSMIDDEPRFFSNVNFIVGREFSHDFFFSLHHSRFSVSFYACGKCWRSWRAHDIQYCNYKLWNYSNFRLHQNRKYV